MEILNKKGTVPIKNSVSWEIQKRNCSYQKFGQLRNEDLHIPLGSSGRYRFVTSKEVGNMRSYYGKTTVQDFIPRKFGFSIGIDCDEKNNNHNCMTPQMTQNVFCMEDGYPDTKITMCTQYFQICLRTNKVEGLARITTSLIDCSVWLIRLPAVQLLSTPTWDYVLYSESKMPPSEKEMVPPCRQACLDLLEACAYNFLPILS